MSSPPGGVHPGGHMVAPPPTTQCQAVHPTNHPPPPPPPTCQTAVPPPPTGHLAVPCQQQLTQQPVQPQAVPVTQVSAQPAHIPTYEIVTSCQPAVVYSNGYYYTSFMAQNDATPMPTTAVHAPPPTVNVLTMSPGGCLACSCGQWAASNQVACHAQAAAAGHAPHHQQQQQPAHHAHHQQHVTPPAHMTQQVPQQS